MHHIAIAEDKARIAAALVADLGLDDTLKVVGTYRDGQLLLDGIAALPNLPDLVLMDIDMPRLDGVAATAALKAQHPQVRVVMLTIFEEDEQLFDAIRAGADGYVLKGTDVDDLHRYIHEALDGGAPMSPAMASKALRFLRSGQTPASQRDAPDIEPLTAREQEVLTHLASGLTYRQVATNLFVSEGTIRKHVEHLYQKLRVNNKTTAVARGREAGLL